MNVLVNLPTGFFNAPILGAQWTRLESFATITRASCNSLEEIAPLLKGKNALMMWSWPRIPPQVLADNPDLRFAAHIDLTQSFARDLMARGIEISLSRRGFSPAVAEMALLLMLSALRRTSHYHAAMWQSRETWVRTFPDEIPPGERQLTHRRVGIVGFGGVGQRLAQLLAPFECDVQIHDPFLPDAVAQKFGVKNVALSELVSSREIVVLCAAANAGSQHLLGEREIAALPTGAILVNVARAALVDNAALLGRLERGDLVAALDVFDCEPLENESPFRTLPNCLLSPHRAGGIWESVERIIRYLVDDLEAWHQNRARNFTLHSAMLASLDA